VVLEIREDTGDNVHEKYRLKEWLANYYTNIEFVLLAGEPESRLLEYCMSRTNPFIVMGGYGRSKISTLIRPSAAATIVKVLSAPIFIAHH
jgi:nucleotide-binding universal stress UspA family protein